MYIKLHLIQLCTYDEMLMPMLNENAIACLTPRVLQPLMRTSLLRMHTMILRWIFKVQSQELARDN